MATIDAKQIIDDALTQLGDTSATHWTSAELLSYLNAGQRLLATLSPKVNSKQAAVQLAAGFKQSLPADGILLIDILYNKGVAGTTNGAHINRVNLDVLRRRLPNWTSSNPSGVVSHYVYDENDPLHFTVYPPQPSTPHYVEMIYSAIPTVIANSNTGTKITIPDFYADPLLDYVLYRAFGKDSEFGNQASRSQSHYQAILQFLGIKTGTDQSISEKK